MDAELAHALLEVARLPARQQTLALARLYTLTKGDARVRQVLALRPPPRGGPDFVATPCAKVALRVAYDGARFGGLAAQRGAAQLLTVENLVLEALRAARLVPRAPERGFAFSRAGRTDAGVSGAAQVLSFYARAGAETGRAFGALPPPDAAAARAPRRCAWEPRINYADAVNRLLPTRLVRATAYAPAADNFDARFSCAGRRYAYLLPRLCAPARLAEAAAVFVGTHDFRNVCCEDGPCVRTVTHAGVEDCGAFLVLRVRGTAFLYHQVRCMVALAALCCLGVYTPEKLRATLEPGAERLKYRPAPAELLVFEGADYDEAWGLEWREATSRRVRAAQGELAAHLGARQFLAGAADMAGWFREALGAP